jgi:tetratricopeptide (TPR) repeat protein
MHDKDLFTQPNGSYMGECPICCLPLSIDMTKSTMMGCCCKYICLGCDYAHQKREIEAELEHRCAFCREPVPKSKEEALTQVAERVKRNDPVAMTAMGKKHYIEGDYGKTLEYYTKAAELGDVAAHCLLGDLYLSGDGVEKDEKKGVYHLEKAAISGHPGARVHLANYEMENGRYERAAKHLIINANLGGFESSLKCVKELFVQGGVSKEDYTAALRGHQTAVDATKSAEREKGEAFFDAQGTAARGWGGG